MTKLKARTVLGVVGVAGYILITAGFFYVLSGGSTIKLPEGDIGYQLIGMFGLIVGTWNSALLMIFNFNFGSSDGSKEKDRLKMGLPPE